MKVVLLNQIKFIWDIVQHKPANNSENEKERAEKSFFRQQKPDEHWQAYFK